MSGFCDVCDDVCPWPNECTNKKPHCQITTCTKFDEELYQYITIETDDIPTIELYFCSWVCLRDYSSNKVELAS